MSDETRRARRVTHRSVFDLLAFGLILVGAFAIYFGRTEKLELSAAAERQIKDLIDWIITLSFVAAGAAFIVMVRLARELVVMTAHLARSSVQAAERIERLVPALDRIAAALERPPGPAAVTPGMPGPGDAAPAAASGRAEAIRRALEAGLWAEARALAEAFAGEEPESAEARALVGEVDRARDAAVGDLRARLDASRSVNDPEAVLDYRGRLAPLLAPGDRRALDRELLRWLLALLMRRMRTGTVRSDVAALAERVAEAFPDSPEGASLRASLPTLRRSAGLCPRCARPYAGVDDACPDCLAAVAASTPGPTILPLRDDETDDPEADAGADGVPDELTVREPE